jgi:hypothetical protein
MSWPLLSFWPSTRHSKLSRILFKNSSNDYIVFFQFKQTITYISLTYPLSLSLTYRQNQSNVLTNVRSENENLTNQLENDYKDVFETVSTHSHYSLHITHPHIKHYSTHSSHSIFWLELLSPLMNSNPLLSHEHMFIIYVIILIRLYFWSLFSWNNFNSTLTNFNKWRKIWILFQIKWIN